jgi:hypothetical protein
VKERRPVIHNEKSCGTIEKAAVAGSESTVTDRNQKESETGEVVHGDRLESPIANLFAP